MSALKNIVERLGRLGYNLEDAMTMKVEEAIKILDEGITKENQVIEQQVESHIEWLGDIARETQAITDMVEVIDLDGSGD
tara:strand:+ start:517 stop:756 length:240 start_codon:yes stop_codon:yes gene_type:complete